MGVNRFATQGSQNTNLSSVFLDCVTPDSQAVRDTLKNSFVLRNYLDTIARSTFAFAGKPFPTIRERYPNKKSTTTPDEETFADVEPSSVSISAGSSGSYSNVIIKPRTEVTDAIRAFAEANELNNQLELLQSSASDVYNYLLGGNVTKMIHRHSFAEGRSGVAENVGKSAEPNLDWIPFKQPDRLIPTVILGGIVPGALGVGVETVPQITSDLLLNVAIQGTIWGNAILNVLLYSRRKNRQNEDPTEYYYRIRDGVGKEVKIERHVVLASLYSDLRYGFSGLEFTGKEVEYSQLELEGRDLGKLVGKIISHAEILNPIPCNFVVTESLDLNVKIFINGKAKLVKLALSDGAGVFHSEIKTETEDKVETDLDKNSGVKSRKVIPLTVTEVEKEPSRIREFLRTLS